MYVVIQNSDCIGCLAFIDHDGHILQFQSEHKINSCKFLPHCPSLLSTSTTGGLKPSISSPGLKLPSSPLTQLVFVAPDTIEKKEGTLGPGSSTSPVLPSVSRFGYSSPTSIEADLPRNAQRVPTNEPSSSFLFGPNGSSRSPTIMRSTAELSLFGGIFTSSRECKNIILVFAKTEVDAVSIMNNSRLQVVNSPPPIQRQSSLHMKLSLPNL